MGIFDDRQNNAEARYVLDAQTEFKAQARRNKRLGLWAAEQMGLPPGERDAYAQSVIVADMEEAGDDDVLRKVSGDFRQRGVKVTDAQLREHMDKLLGEVRRELSGGG